jgi:hypothetical protein
VGKKSRRPRTERRERERALRREVRERERMAAILPGGSPERPIEVATSAVVEIRAAATPCVQCGGQLTVAEHAAQRHGEETLRVVRAACRRCHAPRSLWFRLAPALPS